MNPPNNGVVSDSVLGGDDLVNGEPPFTLEVDDGNIGDENKSLADMLGYIPKPEVNPKLEEARKNLQYNEAKVMDGIHYAEWKEWAGEIITLQREDTQWVWEKLQRLRKLEEVVDQLRRI